MTRPPRVDPAIIEALANNGPSMIESAFGEAVDDPTLEDALFALGVAVGVGRFVALVERAFAWADARPRTAAAVVIPFVRGFWHAAGASARQEQRLSKMFAGVGGEIEVQLEATLASKRVSSP